MRETRLKRELRPVRMTTFFASRVIDCLNYAEESAWKNKDDEWRTYIDKMRNEIRSLIAGVSPPG